MRSKFSQLEAALDVTQRQVSNTQSSFPTLEAERDAYRSLFYAEPQRYQNLEALLGNLCSLLAIHLLLIGSARYMPHHDVYHDRDAYLR